MNPAKRVHIDHQSFQICIIINIYNIQQCNIKYIYIYIICVYNIPYFDVIFYGQS